MMWNNGMGSTGWLFMVLAALALWALVVFALVAMFRGARTGTKRSRVEDDDARRVLDQRFARGEIDAEEYRARQGLLRSAH